MDHNLEIFIEIMDEAGITATKEQLEEVYENFTSHLSMMADTRFEAHKPSKHEVNTCSNCERLESDLKRMQPVSRCCGKSCTWSRDVWVCDSCNRATIRTVKD